METSYMISWCSNTVLTIDPWMIRSFRRHDILHGITKMHRIDTWSYLERFKSSSTISRKKSNTGNFHIAHHIDNEVHLKIINSSIRKQSTDERHPYIIMSRTKRNRNNTSKFIDQFEKLYMMQDPESAVSLPGEGSEMVSIPWRPLTGPGFIFQPEKRVVRSPFLLSSKKISLWERVHVNTKQLIIWRQSMTFEIYNVKMHRLFTNTE